MKQYIRRKSNEVKIGTIAIGGENPIAIQTMANTDTNDIEGSVEQAIRCFDNGAQLLRFTTQGTKETQSLYQIKEILRSRGYDKPLVADIHFNPAVAFSAADKVEKIRINPGNFVNGKDGEYSDAEWADELSRVEEKLLPIIEKCKQNKTTIRIGVNHGSLSSRVMSRYGNTPQGLAVSCIEFIELCRKHDFNNIVLSVKSSNTIIMVHAVRLLYQMMDEKGFHYPIHLGVTEAGSDEEGRIKSAVGIGALLSDGIGDTIRVSLSEAPEKELPVARDLVEYITNKENILTPLQAKYSRRKSVAAGGIGGENSVAVIGADIQLTDIDGNVEVVSIDEKTPSGYAREIIKQCGDKPVVIKAQYDCDLEHLQLYAAADLGSLLIDGLIDGIYLCSSRCDKEDLIRTSFTLLQAARARFTQTEYISCPSCGRTKFDLPHVVRKVKNATSQYVGLKIAVMGCIVNGPGEMADADYGYIGAGRGNVSIYRKNECIAKNIPEAEALDILIQTIERDRV